MNAQTHAYESARAPLLAALASLNQVLLGKDREVRLALACLLARAHLLIEDIPGVGKTTLAHALARVLGLSYQRIQFTSDLLPADVLGISVYDRASGRFRFNRGPVFAQLVIADEVNRATPKAQSAFELVYDVTRFEAREDIRSAGADVDVEQYLKPDAKVPITGKPLSLLEGKTLPKEKFEIGRTLYQLVNDHMTYSKQGTGWGQGDSIWACDSRYGNCRDFHRLFISLARSQRIPAKFEMGFPLPDARGAGDIPGYHCWGKFRPHGRGWIPVDISEANKVKVQRPDVVAYYFGNLTENRIAFTVGRDLVLVPPRSYRTGPFSPTIPVSHATGAVPQPRPGPQAEAAR